MVLLRNEGCPALSSRGAGFLIGITAAHLKEHLQSTVDLQINSQRPFHS